MNHPMNWTALKARKSAYVDSCLARDLSYPMPKENSNVHENGHVHVDVNNSKIVNMRSDVSPYQEDVPDIQ